MSDKYTYADVIIDPDDPRVEIGKEYYFGENAGSVISQAKEDSDYHKGTLTAANKDWNVPFLDDEDCRYPCIIRKKEPKEHYVPFNLSNEEDRARLRGAWVRHKKNPERENLITGIGDETVDFAVYFGDVAIRTDVLLENFEFVDGSPCGKLVEEE